MVSCLERLAAERGAPRYVRFDHGPEFIAYAVADWCRFKGTDTVFIDPGTPWQNAWIESFNGRMRDEYLNGQQFDSLLEAQVLTEDWRIDYNCNRPHSAHGWLTPVEFVEAWLTTNSYSSHSGWLSYRDPVKGKYPSRSPWHSDIRVAQIPEGTIALRCPRQVPLAAERHVRDPVRKLG